MSICINCLDAVRCLSIRPVGKLNYVKRPDNTDLPGSPLMPIPCCFVKYNMVYALITSWRTLCFWALGRGGIVWAQQAKLRNKVGWRHMRPAFHVRQTSAILWEDWLFASRWWLWQSLYSFQSRRLPSLSKAARTMATQHRNPITLKMASSKSISVSRNSPCMNKQLRRPFTTVWQTFTPDTR